LKAHAEYSSTLAGLIGDNSERFGNYQELPEFVKEIFPDLPYSKSQLSLDLPRWNFLDRQMDLSGLSVLEIGSNLGYFCLRLAREKGCRITGYEPIADYAKASEVMAEACGIADLCEFKAEGVSLNEIDALPEASLIIELNVLHHAGAVFDKDLAAGPEGWRRYAVDRLGKLRRKGRTLFFQTGNSRGDETLFPSNRAAHAMKDILEEAGWRILSVGAVANPDNQEYSVYGVGEIDQVPVYDCRRNVGTGMVEYWRDGKLAGQHITGLANRPVWICEA